MIERATPKPGAPSGLAPHAGPPPPHQGVPTAPGAAFAGSAPGAQAAAQQTTLARIREHLTALPLLPQVLLQMLQLDPKGDRYFEQLGDLVRADPGLAIRLLRYANSAALALPIPVASVERAMLMVGAAGVMKLAVAFSAIRVFVPHLEWQKNLWRHAFDVAYLMQALAGVAVEAGIDPQEAYLFGLLHDIGRFVLYLEAPAEIMAVEETDWSSPKELVEAEQRLCGYTHAEIGYLALQRWQLSDRLANRVRYHHDAARWTADCADADRVMLDLMRTADLLSIRLGLGQRLEPGAQAQHLDAALHAARPATPLQRGPDGLRTLVRWALGESERLQRSLDIARPAAGAD